MAKITSTINGSVISFSGGGKTVSFDVAAATKELKETAIIHGFKQKLGDSAALPKGATVDQKMAAIKAMAEQLKTGVWNAGRSGTGGSLAEALHRATGKPLADCVEVVTGLDDDKKGDLRKHPEVAKALAAIAAERAAAKAKAASADDADDLAKLFA